MGRVFRFGDHVDTDLIMPGPYLKLGRTELQAPHVLESLRPDFAREVRPGDIIVAGENFGCGSSREMAVSALRYLGVTCIIAVSLAPIFFRNCVVNGVLPIQADWARQIEDGALLTIGLEEHSVTDMQSRRVWQFPPLPSFVVAVVQCGGLMPYWRKRGPLHA